MCRFHAFENTKFSKFDSIRSIFFIQLKGNVLGIVAHLKINYNIICIMIFMGSSQKKLPPPPPQKKKKKKKKNDHFFCLLL